MRSVLRWLRRLVTGVVLLVAIVTMVAIVTAHTGWGRAWLRAQIEARLQAPFPGGARVGAVEGSLLGTLTVRDLELDGRDHTPLVTIDRLDVAVALWPLVVGTVHVDTLVADGVHVVVHREPPAPASAHASSGPSPWRVELPHVEVHHATVQIEAGDAPQTLADVDLAAAATVDAGAVTMFGWSHGRWDGRATELTAMAAVVLDGGVHVPAALVAIGGPADGATLAMTGLTVDVDHPSGTIAVNAPAHVVATLVPELAGAGIAAERLGDVVAAIDVAAVGPASTRIELNATMGEATMWALLRGELAAQTAQGAIRAHAIDLGLLTRGRARGRGELSVTGAGHRAGGTAWLDLARIVATTGAVDVADQHVTGTFVVDTTARGMIGPALDLHLQGMATGGAVAVEDFAACARGAGPACGRRRSAELGSVRVPFDLSLASAHPTGGAPAFALTGGIVGTALAFGDVTLAAATGRFALHGGAGGPLGAAGIPLGTAHLEATGIRSAGTPVGTVRADLENHADGTLGVAATVRPPTNGLEIFADARVTPGVAGRPTLARLARTHVTLPNGMIWAGTGGTVSVTTTKLALGDLTLHDGEAAVALRGELARSSGALVVHADGDRFLASAIDARYRGLGHGSLDLGRRGGQWQADGTFAVAGFAVAPDGLPIDGAAHVGLAGRRATLEAHATSPALGHVELALEAVAPRDPLDVAAWQALDRGAVRNATITAQQVQVSGLAALAGPPAPTAPATGTIDGTINLAPTALQGALAVRGLALLIWTLDSDLAFAPHDGDLEATAIVRVPGLDAAHVVARLALPERPFDPATWQHRGRDLVKEAAATLDSVALGPALFAKPAVTELLAAHGLAVPSDGRGRIALTLGAAATQARLEVELNDVTGGGLRGRISEHIAINAGAQGTHLRAALIGHDPAPGHELDLGVLEADLPMTPDRWIAEPATALRAPITAQWTLPPAPVPAVLALVGRHDLEGGTLEGDATIRGTLGTPIVEGARIALSEVAVPPRLGGHASPVLQKLEVAATWGGASGTLSVTGQEASGGKLEAFATGRPDALAEVTGSLTARQFDIAPITVLTPRALVPTAGLVSTTDLRLHAGGVLTGKVQLTHGMVPVAAAIGTLRDVAADVTLGERSISGTATGTLGRGTVRLSATAAPDLSTIELRELRLDDISVLGGLRPNITANLQTPAGQPLRREAGVMRGTVTVDGARITLPEHAGPPLLSATPPPDLQLTATTDASAGRDASDRSASRTGPQAPRVPWLEVAVVLHPTQLVARNVVDSVGLTVQGTLSSSNPVTVSVGDTVGVTGTVAIDSADVDFLGRRYIVAPSTVEFDGTTDPLLAIRMAHQFPELTLNVDVEGRASDPKPQFSSEPGAYSRDQLVGFFIGGEPGGDPSSQTGEAVKGAVARGLSRQLGRQIAKVLPIELDALSCEPATTSTSAACSVGKWLSPRLFLTYRHPVEPLPDENANDVQVQYRLGRKTLIDANGGDHQHLGLDLLWRHRW